MTTIARSKGGKSRSDPNKTLLGAVVCFLVLLVIFLSTSSSTTTTTTTNVADNNNSNPHLFQYNVSNLRQGLRSAIAQQRESLAQKLKTLNSGNLPARLQALRENHQIVGERLAEVRAGTETVEEILHGQDLSHHVGQDLPPLELTEILDYLDKWIHQLHETLLEHKHSTFDQIWEAYHDLTVKTLYPWDQQYLRRMPPRRNDGSIFVSVATYRDENCFNTLYHAYEKAKHPERLFIGLVQQNCHAHCRSGVLANLTMVDVPPDDDCEAQFCDTSLGKPICANGQIRTLNIDEPESLGPYAARYFASKLWYGESWYMQIDAHMTFATHWDQTSIDMLHKAPSHKPILSHYPPSHTANLDGMKKRPGARLCGPVFATSDLESQIIRLEGGGVMDDERLDYPGFAPFTAAGYFVAHSDFLSEVPFDVFLPWIFMGEEIIMSSRLWTAGYDIFNPNESVVGHIYVRRHKPKFWESVHRAFTMGVHNPLQMMVLDRIKYQLGYPEAARDMLRHKSLLTAVEQYGMGKARPLSDYLKIVGLNMTTKEVTPTGWCEEGRPPPGFEKYNDLYPKSRNQKLHEAVKLGLNG